MQDKTKLVRFEQAILPHMGAAYNLARWLTRNDQDAEDAVQDAYLRAFRFFDGFRGGDSRVWLLAIVRNTCYTWHQKRSQELTTTFDDELHGGACDEYNPERVLVQRADTQLLKEAIAELAVEFREVVILRDLEGLSYKEIADVVGVPLGTVMSRLARGRGRLRHALSAHAGKEV